MKDERIKEVTDVAQLEASSSEKGDRDFFSRDVFWQGELPNSVCTPENVEQLRRLVATCYREGLAIHTRGGGASYTKGFAALSTESVVLDTAKLNRIIEINKNDMYVTVEPGVTWNDLTNALRKQGLRTPFWGPFSGIAATVGGSISQHSVSHGSSNYGCSADSVISMNVILGDGSILSTGSAARSGSDRFFRHFGPDLTGIFTGDCGTLGVKASITLRLIEVPAVSGAASFEFPSFMKMSRAMAAVARAGITDEAIGLDPDLQKGMLDRQDWRSNLKAGAKVFTRAHSVFSGIKQLVKMVLAGSKYIEETGFTANYVVSGLDAASVDAKLSRLRELATKFGAEIPNSFPAITIAMPFAPLNNILGPRGERWVPIHGVLPFSKSEQFDQIWQRVLDEYCDELQRLKVSVAHMYSTISTNAFLYEIAFYWEDERTSYHEKVIDADYLDSIPAYPANPEGRKLVLHLQKRAIDIWSECGATNFQIGKAYPYYSVLDPAAATILKALKQHLDPKGLMNPGGLELPDDVEHI